MTYRFFRPGRRSPARAFAHRDFRFAAQRVRLVVCAEPRALILLLSRCSGSIFGSPHHRACRWGTSAWCVRPCCSDPAWRKRGRPVRSRAEVFGDLQTSRWPSFTCLALLWAADPAPQQARRRSTRCRWFFLLFFFRSWLPYPLLLLPFFFVPSLPLFRLSFPVPPSSSLCLFSLLAHLTSPSLFLPFLLPSSFIPSLCLLLALSSSFLSPSSLSSFLSSSVTGSSLRTRAPDGELRLSR